MEELMDLRPPKIAGACLALTMLTAIPVATAAQFPERRLTKPDATFPEAFGMVGGLRELRDGRALIADPLGQALMVVDLVAGTADTIGRVGLARVNTVSPTAYSRCQGTRRCWWTSETAASRCWDRT